jgi:predicted membrane protein
MTMLSIMIIMMIIIALTEQFILAFVVAMALFYVITYRQDAHLKLMFFPNKSIE